MLKKSLRLKTSELERVIKEGKVVHTALFTVRTLGGVAGCTKFAVVVSKKIAKTATGRNLIRRRVYEALSYKDVGGTDKNQLINRTKGGFFVVVFVKNRSEKLSVKELSEHIILAFKKLGVA